jgi:hypothetical protein
MKNKLKIFLWIMGSMLFFAACTPDNPQLAPLLPKSALKFSVTPLASNPNMIVLKSETPNVTPYWVTPVGTSIKTMDTIDIPFPGTDTIMYNAMGAGGMTTAEPTVLKITTLDPNAVSDTVWTDLTGGIGHSKTWVLDIDANGVSKYFAGPIYFGGTGWEWDAGWASWICPQADYGTMTFDLIGNANFQSDNKQLPVGAAKGTFMVNIKNMTLQTYGAQVIHDGATGARISNWFEKMTILSISPNTLQLIVPGMDGNSGAWGIYNYVTLDYYNSH